MRPASRSAALLLAIACFSLPAAGAGAAPPRAVEYYHAGLDHYFVSADPAEQALLDAGKAGRWQRTGLSFATGGADAVCRFYGNTQINPDTGLPYGPNSHFYTASASECALLKARYLPDRPSWQYEGVFFTSTATPDGFCPDRWAPVFRAYNNGVARGIAANHRLTDSQPDYLQTLAAGWIGEGAVMCAPPPATSASCTTEELQQLETAMSAILDAASTDTDFTLLLESDDGRSYRHSRGASSADTVYESASTSKLVSATIILDLVARGLLSLDAHPQDFISFWRPPAGHPASTVTLRQLLAFTSGFSGEAACLNLGSADFEQCVRSIYLSNLGASRIPGSEFDYSSSHLQIAGLMALRASGLASWSQLFDEFKARSGLFAHSAYDLPSRSNPRLAGGMHWTGEDYLAFLRALRRGELLTAELRAQLWQNQRGAARVVHSPAIEAIGEDWGYALGNWVECAAPQFDCRSPAARNASPGAYGAYPFIDAGKGYIGLLARQGALGSFERGLTLFRQVQDKARIWATRTCGDDPISGR